MHFKTCGKCGIRKPASGYYRQSMSRDGLASQCKECSDARAKAWRASNPDRARAIRSRWKALNPDEVRRQSRESHQRNPEKSAARKKLYRQKFPEVEKLSNGAWRAENHHRILAANAARRAARKMAAPPWLNESHQDRIRLTYLLASVLSKATGVRHHVDHVIPLCGEIVCGLHVPWNLKAIPAADNIAKRNHFDGDAHVV